mgnify:CR=1 FL=1
MSLEKILYELDQNDTVARIWRRDSGVWGGGGTEQDEIVKRLGIAPTTLNHHFSVVDSFKTVCEQIELFQATVLHVDRLPFKIRTISLEFLGRAVQSSEFLERMLGNGLVIVEMDEFCFFTGKPDSCLLYTSDAADE